MNRKKIGIFLLAGSFALAGCGSQTLPIQQESSTEESQEAGTQISTDAKADSKESEPVTKDIFAMDTYMTLTAYGAKAQEAIDAAEAEIDRIEQLVSTGIETSEIAKINQEGEGTVSEDTEYLIEKSLELYESTEGAFDIAVYPLMEAWGFTDQNYQVPEEERIRELLPLTLAGGVSITIDRDQSKVTLDKKGSKIDLGGIAKGYTSGRIMEVFQSYGVESAVVSLGGNVQVLGKKTDGSNWRVAIENPSADGTYIGVVNASNEAVITSGGYERYFEEGGKTYHHILDPTTGYPAESGLTSVTIISEDGTLADGLSTSLFIMGEEKALSYWKEHATEFQAIFVKDDGTVSITEGLKERFQSDYSYTVLE